MALTMLKAFASLAFTGSPTPAAQRVSETGPTLADRMVRVHDAGSFLQSVAEEAAQRLAAIEAQWEAIESKHAVSSSEFTASAHLIVEAMRDRLQELGRLCRNPRGKQFPDAERLAAAPITVFSFRAAGTDIAASDWTRSVEDWAVLLNILLRRAEFKAFHAARIEMPAVTDLPDSRILPKPSGLPQRGEEQNSVDLSALRLIPAEQRLKQTIAQSH